MNVQGCGLIWDSDFLVAGISKKECKITNCNSVYRLTKVNSCFSYGTVRNSKGEVLYNAGNYTVQNCLRYR